MTLARSARPSLFRAHHCPSAFLLWRLEASHFHEAMSSAYVHGWHVKRREKKKELCRPKQRCASNRSIPLLHAVEPA
eukprot:45093-Pelagomonas_calceolata.AAC.4